MNVSTLSSTLSKRESIISQKKVQDIKNMDFGLAAESLFESHHQDFSVVNNDSNVDAENAGDSDPELDLYDIDKIKERGGNEKLIRNRLERQGRKNKIAFIIYPENKLKSYWDIFMSFVLIISCITTPLRLAFSAEQEL